MLYLVLSILSSTAIVLIFKGFDKYQVNTFHGIVINYLVASGLGYLIVWDVPVLQLANKPWFPYALLVGFLFIVMFYFIAITAQRIGISVSAVAQKMSVVIPVAVAVTFYGDSMGVLKGSGIALALAGVYMTSRKERMPRMDPRFVYLPLILFLGSGFLDTIQNYVERHLLYAGDKNLETLLYVSTLFFVAFILGAGTLIVRRGSRYHQPIEKSAWLGGIPLGIVNFGSIYFLLKTLDAKVLEDSAVFPINNMGIVAASALGGVLIFRERMSLLNIAGVLLSIIAIAMIAASGGTPGTGP